ncbi:MAG: D-alanine--D-alanine ligase family protein [Ilumatobacteraceae bacterium]
MRALATGPAALPAALDPSGPSSEPGTLMRRAGLAPGDTGTGPTTVVLPLLHGPLGEDGTVQGLLELSGVPYVGSGVLASSVAMDKVMAKVVLAQHGFVQAPWRSLREDHVGPTTASELAAELGLPVFVKPANMGSSVGVSKAKTVEEIDRALAVAFSYDEWVVLEAAVVGREIEVAVLGNRSPRASLPGEIVPGEEFYDYEDKYVTDGAELHVPAPLDDAHVAEVQQLAVRAFQALRCEGMARVDFFLDTVADRFVLNEVNTIPGFTPISMYPKMWEASGLAYPALIDELVRLAIERHGQRRRNTGR